MVFRSLSNRVLNKDEVTEQADLLFKMLKELDSNYKRTNYNFLVIMSEGGAYRLSVPAIRYYHSILESFDFVKVAIVAKSTALIKFISNVIRLAGTEPKYQFFDNKEEARHWLNEKIEQRIMPGTKHLFL